MQSKSSAFFFWHISSFLCFLSGSILLNLHLYSFIIALLVMFYNFINILYQIVDIESYPSFISNASRRILWKSSDEKVSKNIFQF